MPNNFAGTCYYTLSLTFGGTTPFDCRYAGHSTDASFPCSATMTRFYCDYGEERGPTEKRVTVSKTCTPSVNRAAPTGSIKRTNVSSNFVPEFGATIPAGYYIKIAVLQAGSSTGCYYYDPYYRWDPYCYPDGCWIGAQVGTRPTTTTNGFQYISARITNSATGVVSALNAYIVYRGIGTFTGTPFAISTFLGLGSSQMAPTSSDEALYYDLYLYNSIVQSTALGISRDFANAAPCLSC